MHQGRPSRTGERLNRTLLERMHAGLIDAGLQKKFWPYAVENAAYTSKFVPTKGQTQTPYELFWGKVPDISHLRVFGCKATEFKPSHLRDKLHEVSTQVILVSYARHSKAWKLLHRENGKLKVTESANVMFQEDQRQPDAADLGPPAEDYEELLLFDDDSEEDRHDLVSVDTEEWSLSDDGSGDPDEEWLDQNEQVHQQPVSDTDMDSDDDDADDEPAEGGGGDDVMAPADEPRYPQRIRNAPNLPYQAQLFLAEGVNDGIDLRIPPRNWKQAMRRPDVELWQQARDEELAALAAKGVYEVCELPVPEGKRVLNSMGTLAVKFDAKGNLDRHKYRLVARGDHQRDDEVGEKFAPTAQSATFRMLLALKAANPRLKMRQLDVKTAFLNSRLKEEVYVPPPEAGQPGVVWRLLKALYGLKQAARAWNETLTAKMQEDGYHASQHDPCLFMRGHGLTRAYVVVLPVHENISLKREHRLKNTCDPAHGCCHSSHSQGWRVFQPIADACWCCT